MQKENKDYLLSLMESTSGSLDTVYRNAIIIKTTGRLVGGCDKLVACWYILCVVVLARDKFVVLGYNRIA